MVSLKAPSGRLQTTGQLMLYNTKQRIIGLQNVKSTTRTKASDPPQLWILQEFLFRFLSTEKMKKHCSMYHLNRHMERKTFR